MEWLFMLALCALCIRILTIPDRMAVPPVRWGDVWRSLQIETNVPAAVIAVRLGWAWLYLALMEYRPRRHV